jgi:hypothetical protein
LTTTVPNLTELMSQAQKQATASIEASFDFAERALELQKGYTLKIAEILGNAAKAPAKG